MGAVRDPIDVSMNSIKDPSVLKMNHPAIRSKYPVNDRISLALCGCCTNVSPIDLMNKQPPFFRFEE